jgi:hypothetical protein
MTSETIIKYPSVTLASKVLDCVDNLRNAVVTDQSVNEILTSIRELVHCSNAKSLKKFPVDIVCKQSNTLPTEIKSWYYPNLNLINIPELISSTFEELERDPYRIDTGTRCIDALRILVDYNAVVLSRREHYLELQEKKSDDRNSSKLIETTIQLVNGDVYG